MNRRAALQKGICPRCGNETGQGCFCRDCGLELAPSDPDREARRAALCTEAPYTLATLLGSGALVLDCATSALVEADEIALERARQAAAAQAPDAPAAG